MKVGDKVWVGTHHEYQGSRVHPATVTAVYDNGDIIARVHVEGGEDFDQVGVVPSHALTPATGEFVTVEPPRAVKAAPEPAPAVYRDGKLVGDDQDGDE